MIAICPVPRAWHRVFQRLVDFAQQRGETGPPAPLILSGWTYSSDADKHARWQQTVRWAEERDCLELLQDITPDDMYRAPGLSSYRLGDERAFWNTTERPLQPPEQLASSLAALLSNWDEIAPGGLSLVTRPLGWSGRKSRRLVVWADASAAAPWGTWASLDDDRSKRRSFTRLRASVNVAIQPHAVDDIVFVHDPDYLTKRRARHRYRP
ncbi:MAG: hypothetical protein IT182_16870 [Acidobacteria bacterium]|nr:hypothetical protein [Acidobacteriota bacterium]